MPTANATLPLSRMNPGSLSLDHLINPVNVTPDILHILDSLDAIIRQHELRRRASSERIENEGYPE